MPVKGNLQATNSCKCNEKMVANNVNSVDELQMVSMAELYDTVYPARLPVIEGLLGSLTVE